MYSIQFNMRINAEIAYVKIIRLKYFLQANGNSDFYGQGGKTDLSLNLNLKTFPFQLQQL